MMAEMDDNYNDPILIAAPKTFHIQNISGIFPSPPISADPGK
jgi:hypothetical protein